MELGRLIIDAWREDGILRLQMTPKQIELFLQANMICRRFFSLPLTEKTKCVDERTYSGYTASGEEITNNIQDLPEIFTVMKDISAEDERSDIWEGPHTDCGLTALTGQDSNRGLWVSPPGERNSSRETENDDCSDNEDSGLWVYVPPVEDTLAILLGDMMSYVTLDYVPATLHKVNLSNAERYSRAYFVEPAFDKSGYFSSDSHRGRG